MTTHQRLAAAALVSLALHALVMGGAWLPVPELPPPQPRLEARLVAPPPLAEPVSRPVPAPRARQKRATTAVPSPALPAPAPVAPPPVVVAPELAPAPDPQPEVAVAEPATPEPPQPVAVAPAASPAPVAPRALPRRGRIAFNILYGNNRFPVGKMVQSWEVEAGSYRLASEAETSGIVDLFRPQRLRHISQGKVMPHGLRPDSFLVSRTRRGQNEASQARFDWSAGQLTYGSARDQKHAALPAGTQDLMSLMYQFSLTPPAPGRHRFPIATGSRFEVYDIEVAVEETIETPLGTLKALPVKQIARAGSESIEFWLAAEYRYLPVKIRHYDREGNFSGEQVVSEIRVSDD